MLLALSSLCSVVYAEGVAQLGLTQRLLDFDAVKERGFAPDDRSASLYVDILRAGEVINFSLCGMNYEDDLSVDVYAPMDDTTPVFSHVLKSANLSCTGSMDAPLENPLRFVTEVAGTHRVVLQNLDNTGVNDSLFRRYDITVTDSVTVNPDPTLLQGRLWGFTLGLNAGGFGAEYTTDADIYVKVPGGRPGSNYVWVLDLNNFAGYTYNLLANSLGVNPPLSGYSTEAEGQAVAYEFPLYLSYPAVAAPRPDISPLVQEVRFIDDSGQDQSISPGFSPEYQDTGFFEFSTDVVGTYSVLVDLNRDGIYGNAGDRQLLGKAVPGFNRVVWDGLDALGNTAAAGNYFAEVQVHVGEYHFIAVDAETSGGDEPGLTIFMANADGSRSDTRVYWDDVTVLSALDGTSNTPHGALSSQPAARHTWGNFTGSGFGNERYIDTYVYGLSTVGYASVVILNDDTPVENHDAVVQVPTSVEPGKSIIVAVRDADLDGSVQFEQQALVTIVNTSTGESESVRLGATADAAGFYSAGLPTRVTTTGESAASGSASGVTAGSGDGVLGVAAGDNVTVMYIDFAAADHRSLQRNVNLVIGADRDADGIIDSIDTDDDGDGVPDIFEGAVDSDNDGVIDSQDIDSDNNGLPDSLEALGYDTASQSWRNLSALVSGEDSDSDGIDDAIDADVPGMDISGVDGGGAARGSDLNDNGILDAFEPSDTDGDGVPDFADSDNDGDGIPDALESVALTTSQAQTTSTTTDSMAETSSQLPIDSITELAGQVGSVTSDADRLAPVDSDGDGLPDINDPDSDNDGIGDAIEFGRRVLLSGADADHDGIDDALDAAVVDAIDGASGAFVDGTASNPALVAASAGDANANGILDSIEPLDTDADGVADFRDHDSDGDGIADWFEGVADTDNDGVPDRHDLDSDADGLADAYEWQLQVPGIDDLLRAAGSATGSLQQVGDLALEGGTNPTDQVSTENAQAAVARFGVDSDNDGLPDAIDVTVTGGVDRNRDGIDDAIAPRDSDLDGIPNFLDRDSDNDGLADTLEAGLHVNRELLVLQLSPASEDSRQHAHATIETWLTRDWDADGSVALIDSDSDNDGVADGIEHWGAHLAQLSWPGVAVSGVDELDGVPEPIATAALIDNLSALYRLAEIPVEADTSIETAGNDVIPATVDALVEILSRLTLSTADINANGIDDWFDATVSAEQMPEISSTNLAAPRVPAGASDQEGGDATGGLIGPTTAQSQVIAVLSTVLAVRVDADANALIDLAQAVDWDGDGNADTEDLDSDNDGIADGLEHHGRAPSPTTAPFYSFLGNSHDSDADGIANAYDVDSDNDTIPDVLEGIGDGDDDGYPDYLDLDSDNDAITDLVEFGLALSGAYDAGRLSAVEIGHLNATAELAGAALLSMLPVSTLPEDATIMGSLTNLGEVIEPAIASSDTELDSAVPDPADMGGVTGTASPLKLIPQQATTHAQWYAPDAVFDALQAGLDSDADGVADFRDLDSDNDGHADLWEALAGTHAARVDSDADGRVDALIGVPVNPSDGFSGGHLVSTEGAFAPLDSDLDGVPDLLDLDSDNNGVPDSVEGLFPDRDGDGRIDTPVDTDGDGLHDVLQLLPLSPADFDADNIPNARDLDSDGDGNWDLAELSPLPGAVAADVDGDGQIDDFIDNNGDGADDRPLFSTPGSHQWPDVLGVDAPVSGVLAELDGPPGGSIIAPVDAALLIDTDRDGIPDAVENQPSADSSSITGTSSSEDRVFDRDGDGIPNALDEDSDNDGIPDAVEGAGDTDADGLPDYLDEDADNDTIPDRLEGALDTDADGIPDRRDPDADNDSIPDYLEAWSGGQALAAELDVLLAALEENSGSAATELQLADSDSDGIADIRDRDSDNDGLADLLEAGGVDSDGDGEVDDFLDLNRDGVDDGVALVTWLPIDSDGDGVADFRDVDSDNDSHTDLAEALGFAADADANGRLDAFVDNNRDGFDDTLRVTIVIPEDVDGDGAPDHIDLDADGDGVSDLVEGGSSDANGDGRIDSLADADADGIPDQADASTLAELTGSAPVDQDGDGISDMADADTAGAGADTDGDGIVDLFDPDPDGDGSAAPQRDMGSLLLPDTNADGIPDIDQFVFAAEPGSLAPDTNLIPPNPEPILGTAAAQTSVPGELGVPAGVAGIGTGNAGTESQSVNGTPARTGLSGVAGGCAVLGGASRQGRFPDPLLPGMLGLCVVVLLCRRRPRRKRDTLVNSRSISAMA